MSLGYLGNRLLGLVVGYLGVVLLFLLLKLVGMALPGMVTALEIVGALASIPLLVLGWYDGAYLAGRITGKLLKLLK